MKVDTKNLKHLAIIMDGNGRWAKSKGKPRFYGHYKGVLNIIKILREAYKLDIFCVSMFCFSTENWNRPKDEIDHLFKYIETFFKKNIDEFIKKEIKINISGDISKLPIDIQKIINESLNKTKNFNKMVFNICLNYGGRDDIVNACKNITNDVINNKINLNDINEISFKNYLYTKDLPDVDLLIRTSGEERISNFLLYQLAYAELIFVEKYWPEFNIKDLHECINIYNKRKRRFGGL